MSETIYSRKFAAGEEIFRIGDQGRNAYFIEKGRVEITNPRDGEDLVLATLGVGEIFGEMSMIDDAPRSATVRALEDTEVIIIQRSRIMQPVISADPMMNLILRVVLARFRGAQHKLAGMSTEPGEIDRSLGEIRDLAIKRINFEKDMRRGLELGQFEMHYQPIVALDGRTIAGFEALMRWQKDDGGFISPGEFIPLAEQTGLIIELGRRALEDGLRDQIRLAETYKSVYPHQDVPFMSINVSGMQLTDLAEIDLMAGLIEESGADPAHIKLEITETLLVENFDHAIEALQKLKSLGVLIAIDDFGTGYSSLSYLHQFPLDTLKIDRAFVVNMHESDNSRRIVRSIVQLALSLNMSIVAEGIEEMEQLSTLHALGSHYGQGYLMSKPLPFNDALALIESKPIW